MKKEKLDDTDKRILYLLDMNARTPNSKISKVVHLSKPAIEDRISKLCSLGVIKKFQLVLNPMLLGLEHFKVYIRLQDAKISTETKITEYLSAHPDTLWVVSCRGRWDIITSFLSPNLREFGKSLREFIDKFDSFILERSVVSVEEAPTFNRSYLWPGKRRIEIAYGGPLKQTKLDLLDQRILIELSKNARERIVKISKRVGASPETVRLRIRNMEKAGLVQAYRVAIDLEKIDYEGHLVALSFRNLNAAIWKKIVAFGKSNDNIIYMPKTIGDHDLDLEVEVRGARELTTMLNSFRNRFGSVMRGFETTQITKEHKLEFFHFPK